VHHLGVALARARSSSVSSNTTVELAERDEPLAVQAASTSSSAGAGLSRLRLGHHVQQERLRPPVLERAQRHDERAVGHLRGSNSFLSGTRATPAHLARQVLDAEAHLAHHGVLNAAHLGGELLRQQRRGAAVVELPVAGVGKAAEKGLVIVGGVAQTDGVSEMPRSRISRSTRWTYGEVCSST